MLLLFHNKGDIVSKEITKLNGNIASIFLYAEENLKLGLENMIVHRLLKKKITTGNFLMHQEA